MSSSSSFPEVVEWGYQETTAKQLAKMVGLIHASGTDGDGLWHVMFRCGTTIVLEAGDQDEFTGYEELHNYEENWPSHRVRGDPQPFIRKNYAVWEVQKATPEPHGTYIRAAYKKLLYDDYPYPGAGADRMVDLVGQTEDESLWLLSWIQRDPHVVNFFVTEKNTSRNEANVIGADLRRYDHLATEVYAIVEPTGVLHVLPRVLPKPQKEDT